MLVVSLPVAVRADENRRGRDITPDPALFFSNFSEGLAFRGDKDVLAFSGRAGFKRSENGGDHWNRAMNGFVDSQGVEPFGSGLCQAPSSPGTVYSATGAAVPILTKAHVETIMRPRRSSSMRSWVGAMAMEMSRARSLFCPNSHAARAEGGDLRGVEPSASRPRGARS